MKASRNPLNVAIAAIVLLCLTVGAIAFGHGCYRDLVADEMHGDGCYWCNFYRWGHADNAAFQMRELRRSGER